MVTTVNLEAYYKFDETSGAAIDAHKTNDATVSGVTQNSLGIINTGYSFDGSSNYVRVPAVTNILASSGTISMWVNPDAVAATDRIFDERTASYITARFTDTGVLLFRAYDSTNSYYDVYVTVSTGSWQHLVFSWDDNGLYVYKNGSIVDSDTDFSGGLYSDGQDNGINLGRPRDSLSTATYFFDGYMDEVGIWSRALTSTEVSDLYNNGHGLAYPFISGLKIKINIGDTWKAVPAAYINIGDSWKAVASIKQNIGDSWKSV